jgi:hypothetical protein
MNIFAMSVKGRKGMGARTCAPVLILVATLAWAIALPLSGCTVHKQPKPGNSVIFSGCVIAQDVAGTNRCACHNPVYVSQIDGQTGKPYWIAYCESQVQP